MKLIEKMIAVSSVFVGSMLLWCSVSNLEAQQYVDSPLFDWKILCIAGIIALIPGLIILVRKG